MPDQFSVEDFMENFFFIHKVELGLQESKQNKTITHEEVKDQLKKWLK